MSLSREQQQAIYNKCRTLLDMHNFNAIQISQAHNDLKECLQKTLEDTKLEVLPLEVVTIFITAFITSPSALENLRTELNSILVSLSKEKPQEYSEAKRLKHPEEFDSATDTEVSQDSQQQVPDHNESVINKQIEQVEYDLKQVEYDLKVVDILYAQTKPGNPTQATPLALRDFIEQNTLFQTTILQYFNKKARKILHFLDFSIEVTDEELIQKFQSYLESNQKEKAEVLKIALKTRVRNNFLNPDVIWLLAPYTQQPELHTDECPALESTMDYFVSDEFPNPEKLRGQMQAVKFILVKLGFQFEQSRVNSRASTPLSGTKDKFDNIHPITPTPPPEDMGATPSSPRNLAL